jgi:hypothetical protein
MPLGSSNVSGPLPVQVKIWAVWAAWRNRSRPPKKRKPRAATPAFIQGFVEKLFRGVLVGCRPAWAPPLGNRPAVAENGPPLERIYGFLHLPALVTTEERYVARGLADEKTHVIAGAGSD